MPLTVGSLFAGIGGFDLGFERAGMVTRWQVEQDEFCCKVLARHFPDAKQYEDVRDVGRHNLEPVDVIAGGFPCQDLSYAGNRAGIEEGTRSGLWSEYARIVGELRPRYVVVENVAALLDGGMGIVLSDMAKIGYDAEWDCIPAASLGAPHSRDRCFIVAYPAGTGQNDRLEAGASGRTPLEPRGLSGGRMVGLWPARNAWVGTEPNVGRMAYGVPCQMDRLRTLGNAVVPQIAEWIGRRLVVYESDLKQCGLAV